MIKNSRKIRYNGKYYDPVTGMPNMTSFFDLAEIGKSAFLKKGAQPVLLYSDFKGMKFFNREYGFEEGTVILLHFAEILKKAFAPDSCCRIGDDHFAVITEEAGLEEKLNSIFEEWHKVCNGRNLPVHVGIYRSVGDMIHVSVALDRARLACNELKGSYSSCFAYYNKKLSEGASQKQYILENIDRAIEEKWIKLYLQPIIRTVSGRVCDVEALARWDDPEMGMISPAVFIEPLEEAGLIYKLDLYMLEQILEAIRIEIEKGLYIVPHSLNISRSDFDACDIVEEVRRRVDDAGVPRDRVTIEVTESCIASDFEYLKKQIDRFKALGFPVWLDDFGSGYSSLDNLQSLNFDLIKFDMSFMRKFNEENEESRVLLSELMRLATALELDTVCEGVETEDQERFLKEIGCSKLQGFHYSKPIPFDMVQELFDSKLLTANEDPAESEYYETIGRMNLFDLGVITSRDDVALHNAFSTIPIAIIEVKDGEASYVRSNRSYQEFAKKLLGKDIIRKNGDSEDFAIGYGEVFPSVIMQCCEDENRVFFDEKMPDERIAHAFARRICVNPVTGSTAIAIAVLSLTEPDENTTYEAIAKALAADYYNLFVIDMDTNNFVEYSSKIGDEKLSVERYGEEFFESAKRDTMTRIYEEDREMFLSRFSKEQVIQDLDAHGVFTTTYRLIDTGEPMYVNMKITRMRGGNRIILGISIIDAQIKQQEEEKRLRQERISLGRIVALSSDFIVLYIVDPATGSYTQYNPSSEYEKFGLATTGEDFFSDVVSDAPKAIYPDDIERHLRVLTKDNMMSEIEHNGFFLHNYRLLMDGQPVPVSLRATMAPEEEGEKILLGVIKDDMESARRKLIDVYENEREKSLIFTHIALSLARGYTDLYYVNMETDSFIEFHTDDESGVLTAARQGTDFFEGCERDAKLFVHPDDQELFVRTMSHDFLNDVLRKEKVYEFIYRRIKGEDTFYVRMRVSRMDDDDRYIVLAVADIDEEIRRRREVKRIKEERIVYARLSAITGNYICIYVVDPENGNYHEFSSVDGYEETFEQAKEGTDFFNVIRGAAREYSHPDDTERVMSRLTQDNVMAEIERSGIFTLGYRIMVDGRPVHFQLKAAMVEEEEGQRIIVGLNNIDAQVRQEEEYERLISKVRSQVNIDALTGVKNKHAYLEAEEKIDVQMEEQNCEPFSVVVMDVNDLKKVNDTEGHQAGDDYLKDACRIICNIFKHSPVFRIGGDEFAVIAQGVDHEHIEERLRELEQHNTDASDTNGIKIACGMAEYEDDKCMADVFERADRKMYDNKKTLKIVQGREDPK